MYAAIGVIHSKRAVANFRIAKYIALCGWFAISIRIQMDFRFLQNIFVQIAVFIVFGKPRIVLQLSFIGYNIAGLFIHRINNHIALIVLGHTVFTLIGNAEIKFPGSCGIFKYLPIIHGDGGDRLCTLWKFFAFQPLIEVECNAWEILSRMV